MKFSAAMKALEEGQKVNIKGMSGWIDKESWSKEMYQNGKAFYDHMLESDWELYTEPQKSYRLWELLDALKEGKRIRRKSFYEGDYIVKRKDSNYIYTSLPPGNWSPTTEDLEANDWLVVDE